MNTNSEINLETPEYRTISREEIYDQEVISKRYYQGTVKSITELKNKLKEAYPKTFEGEREVFSYFCDDDDENKGYVWFEVKNLPPVHNLNEIPELCE